MTGARSAAAPVEFSVEPFEGGHAQPDARAGQRPLGEVVALVPGLAEVRERRELHHVAAELPAVEGNAQRVEANVR